MVWWFFFLNLCVILLSAVIRYAGDGLPYAAPVAMPVRVWWGLIWASLAALIAANVANRRRMADPAAKRAVLELLVFPAFFAFEWCILPPYHWRATDCLIMGLLVGVIAAILIHDRRNWREWGVTGNNFGRACAMLAIPTAVMVGLPLAAIYWLGTDFDSHRLPAAAAYPFYALAQLAAFQLFLVPRLRRLGGPTWAVVLVAAGVFALVHWPNGVVMAACFACGCVWTLVYLKRPNIYALALSMGIAAAVFANALPREITHNLRTGPIYVERLLDKAGR